MPINLYGNINGTYQPPQINLLDSVKPQNSPVRYNETEVGKNNPVVKVNISKEGLRALHGSKLPGSVDIKAEQERIRFASDHQPTESYYTRMSREMNNTLEQNRYLFFQRVYAEDNPSTQSYSLTSTRHS